jgi:tRNA(Ile)-lysidine synthetase-like protein
MNDITKNKLKNPNANVSLRKPFRIAIALSGGVDSVVLLNLMTKYKKQYNCELEIHALTIDHGLRKESHQEARNLQNVVINKMKYPIIHKILKIDEKINLNQLEKHARELRYDLMYKYCQNEKIEEIFMGHHLDDQLETFVIRLLSNSTIFGLIGIKHFSPANLYGTNRINLCRPLLEISKNEIYEFAKAENLEWFEDYTNKNINLTKRNKIRYLLENNLTKRNELISLHRKLVDLLDNVVYARLLKLENNEYPNINLKYKFDSMLMIMDIEFEINCPFNELTEIDYLVINRWLFNKVWLVSPQSKYFYNFSKFDNKYSRVIKLTSDKSKKLRSLFEDLVNNKRKKDTFTLSGCLFAYHINQNVIKLQILREQPHRGDITIKTLSPPCNPRFIYDNRIIVNATNIDNFSKYTDHSLQLHLLTPYIIQHSNISKNLMMMFILVICYYCSCTNNYSILASLPVLPVLVDVPHKANSKLEIVSFPTIPLTSADSETERIEILASPKVPIEL